MSDAPSSEAPYLPTMVGGALPLDFANTLPGRGTPYSRERLVSLAALADWAFHAGQIDALNAEVYDLLNNGVYKAGFASTQSAYDEAVAGVFQMLDRLEAGLTGTYLFGDRLTEADIRLFVTLIRFDAAYHGLFKTNLRRVADYPRLSAYMERILRLPGLRETVSLDHIKAGYYSIKALNPNGIVPAGPGHVTALLETVR